MSKDTGTPNITIASSAIRLTINNDPARVIEFDPKDVTFAENFFLLMGNFENRLNSYKSKMSELTKDKTLDANGVPVNVGQRLEVLKETCDYMRAQIDFLFGNGTSQTAFGNSRNLEAFIQFLDQVTPFVEKLRVQKVQQYTTTAAIKRNRRRIKPKAKK